MAKRTLERPALDKPVKTDEEKTSNTRLSNIKKNNNSTTGEGPKTVRLTAAEKMMCAQLVEEIQELTPKMITQSKVLRAALYIARQQGPDKILSVIKENL